MCKRTGIARGLPAKPGKKLGELQLSEHACHVILCDRQEPQADIAGELDQNPTCPDEQQGAVERIVPRADDGLHPGHHLLDQESPQSCLRMRFLRLRQQRLGGRLHFLAGAQVKRDPAGFGLVQDLVGTNLQCDREADALGRRYGLRGVCNSFALRHDDAVLRESCVQRRRRKPALGRGRRQFRRTASARRMKPQRIERADGGEDPLQKRKAGRLLRRDLQLVHLRDHAAKGHDRLLRPAEQGPQRSNVAPGVGLARHGRSPGNHIDVGIGGGDRTGISGNFEG